MKNPPVALIAYHLITEVGLTLAAVEQGDPQLIEQIRQVERGIAGTRGARGARRGGVRRGGLEGRAGRVRAGAVGG